MNTKKHTFETIRAAALEQGRTVTQDQLDNMVKAGLLSTEQNAEGETVYVTTPTGQGIMLHRMAYREAINACLQDDGYNLEDGTPVKAQAFSYLVRSLRDYPYRLEVPGGYGGQRRLFEQLGYTVDHGRSHRGYTKVRGKGQRCELVYLEPTRVLN